MKTYNEFLKSLIGKECLCEHYGMNLQLTYLENLDLILENQFIKKVMISSGASVKSTEKTKIIEVYDDYLILEFPEEAFNEGEKSLKRITIEIGKENISSYINSIDKIPKFKKAVMLKNITIDFINLKDIIAQTEKKFIVEYGIEALRLEDKTTEELLNRIDIRYIKELLQYSERELLEIKDLNAQYTNPDFNKSATTFKNENKKNSPTLLSQFDVEIIKSSLQKFGLQLKQD